MSSKNIKVITDNDFEEAVLSSDKPVLVDFYADWCGPCKAISPYLETLAEEFKDKVTIAKINVDANQIYPGRFNVRSIPTMILFKNGQQAALTVGADPAKIRQMVDQA